MQGPSGFLNVLTIPVGANIYQERIVIDGVRGAIFLYANGTLGGGAALVQSASNTAASATSCAVTLTNKTAAGNCLIVSVGTIDTTDNPTVSGVTLGGSPDNFTVANTAYNNADVNAAFWIDPSCAGGQTSVVVSLTGGVGASPFISVTVMEWSGIQTNPLDKAPVGQNGNSTTWSSGPSGILSQEPELALGNAFVTSGTFTPPGSPWINTTETAADNAVLFTGYQVVSTTASVTYNGSVAPAALFGSTLITLKTNPQTLQPGQLIASIAAFSGIDPVTGVAYPQGFTTYSQGLSPPTTVVLANNGLNWTSTTYPNGFPAGIVGEPSQLDLVSGTQTVAGGIASIELFSSEISSTGAAAIILNQKGTGLPVPVPTNYPLTVGTSTLAQTQTAFNSLVANLIAAGVVV